MEKTFYKLYSKMIGGYMAGDYTDIASAEFELDKLNIYHAPVNYGFQILEYNLKETENTTC